MNFGTQTICAIAFAGLALGWSVPMNADSLTVKTEDGKVQGKTINDGKVRAFLGLPYAAPPIGDLRWKAPQPVASWKGVRDATKFGNHCAQNGSSADMVFLDSGASEDCLYLNVYTPADAKPGSKLPVMYWIHGGGYVGGASSEPRHNGDFLPLKGVVLVTINYRLGVFGFLATSELAKEGNGHAGNYALMDMIAGLHWVKNNIAQFGGDPGNVTIFGESAGSFAVSTLMVSPLAQGLFAKAIGESGSGLSALLGGGSLDDQVKANAAWMDAANIKSLKDLRAMTTDDVLKAASKKGMLAYGPVIDGLVLAEPVADSYAAGRQAHVPLLAGWNRDEGSGMAGASVTVNSWKARAAKLFGDRSAEFLTLYPGDDDAQALRSSIDYGGDGFIAFGTWQWVEAQTKTGQSPVYRYHLELPAPPSKFHPGNFAFHSDDIEYVFGTLDTRPGSVWRDEDRKLSELMMSYWTNFAKTGDPNGPGLPEWPRYDKSAAVMHLDADSKSAPDATRPRYDFLSQGMPPFQF